MTATLPEGVGEATTVYQLNKFSSFNILSAFRIFVITRLMDLAAFSAVLLFAFIQISTTASYREVALWLSGSLFIISIFVIHLKIEHHIVRLIQKMPFKGQVMNRIRERFDEINRISESQSTLLGFMTFQSIVMILIAALSIHFVLRSLGDDFNYVQSFYCFEVYALFQIIQVQGIAGIGTQTAWWSIVLTVAGYKSPDAIAMGIVLHGTLYIFIALMGLSGSLFLTARWKR
jgi:hypothetical protein